MQPSLEMVISNACIAFILALGVMALGRIWKNPPALHFLWILVLLKLVTPPFFVIPISLQTGHNSQALPKETTAISSSNASLVSSTLDIPDTIPKKLNIESQENGNENAFEQFTWHLPRFSWQGAAINIWCIGIVLCIGIRSYRIMRFKRLMHESLPPSQTLMELAASIAKQMGLKSVPPIRVLSLYISPLVWSLDGRPCIILPLELFENITIPSQKAILTHELAHVYRKDHWVRLLELFMTTFFWWHPVVWWAARQLQELEDQCCDAMVMDLISHNPKNYAVTLLDTLDFLCDRSIPVPLSVMAAKSSILLARRISMLKNRSWSASLAFNRMLVLLALIALPMTIAFGQKPTQTADEEPQAVAEIRVLNKLVKEFPEDIDLSTPETAFAAYERAWARQDAKAVWELGWFTVSQKVIDDTKNFIAHDAGKDPKAYCEFLLNTEVVEVATYRGDYANVISKLNIPDDKGQDPYSSRSFGRINGVWKNLGEDRLPSLEAARECFEQKKEFLWQHYLEVRDNIQAGKPVSAGGKRAKVSAPTAPGESMGISVEKADLMGRVEWALMHGGRDITSRKTIEWGEVERLDNGNRQIRYKFEATVWDKDKYIINKIFAFDALGNIVDVEDVEGFPQKKVEKPVDVSSQVGMKELVEDFFSNNFRDITSRESIEWGEVVKLENGNSSIQCKYRARIWDKETKIMNQIFTFDSSGKYVSVKNVDGFPQDP